MTPAGCLSGAAAAVPGAAEHGALPSIDLDSDEFRRLASTNEYIAAPHIYALDGDYVAPYYYAGSRRGVGVRGHPVLRAALWLSH